MQYRQTDAMPRTARERTDFGLRLYDARKGAELTQKQVLSKIGIPQSTLSELETVATSSGYVAQLAALYKVDAHFLATGEPAPPHANIAESAPSTVEEPAKPYDAFTAQERQVIADLRALPDEDRARLIGELGARAEQMRRFAVKVLEQVGYKHAHRPLPGTRDINFGGDRESSKSEKKGS
jgi:transcriptional regulator with XRE-family HTH domain